MGQNLTEKPALRAAASRRIAAELAGIVDDDLVGLSSQIDEDW